MPIKLIKINKSKKKKINNQYGGVKKTKQSNSPNHLNKQERKETIYFTYSGQKHRIVLDKDLTKAEKNKKIQEYIISNLKANSKKKSYSTRRKSSSSKSQPKQPSPKPKQPSPKPKQPSPQPKQPSPKPKQISPKPKQPSPKQISPKPKQLSPKPKQPSPKPKPIIVYPEFIKKNKLLSLFELDSESIIPNLMTIKVINNQIPLHVYNINNNCFADTVIIILSIYLRCSDLYKNLRVLEHDSEIDKKIKNNLKNLFNNIFKAGEQDNNVLLIQELRLLFKDKYNPYLHADNHIDLNKVTTCDNFLVFILMTLRYFRNNEASKITDNVTALNLNLLDLNEIQTQNINNIKHFNTINQLLTKDIVFFSFPDLELINNYFPDLKHNPKMFINNIEYSIVGIIMRSNSRTHFTVKYLNPLTHNVEFFDDTFYKYDDMTPINLMPLKSDFSNNDLDNFFHQTQTSLVFLIKSELLPVAAQQMNQILRTI